jgi:hypothetical protein
MKCDPMAITAAVAAARILGHHRMFLTLFIDEAEADAVSALISEVMGVNTGTVRYSPPRPEREHPVFTWDEDGDGKVVRVAMHVMPEIRNDNALKEG